MQIVDNLTVTMKRFERVRTKCNTTVTELQYQIAGCFQNMESVTIFQYCECLHMLGTLANCMMVVTATAWGHLFPGLWSSASIEPYM